MAYHHHPHALITVIIEWEDPKLRDDRQDNFMQNLKIVEQDEHRREEPICQLINRWACRVDEEGMMVGMDILGRYDLDLIVLVRPVKVDQELYIHSWDFAGFIYTREGEQLLIYKKVPRGDETFDGYPHFASPLRLIATLQQR